MDTRITLNYKLVVFILFIGLMIVSCDNTEITPDQANTFIKYNGVAGDIIGYDVIQSSSGNYYVTGTASTVSGENDLILITTDLYGNRIGDIKYYGGLSDDYGTSVQVADDGSIYIAGVYTQELPSKNTDVYLLKLNTSGDTLWTKTFGGNSDDQSTSMLIDTDGNLVIAGTTKSYGNGGKDGLFIKTDTDGNLLEAIKTYGFDYDDDIQSVIQFNGGYYFLGSTFNYQQNGDTSLFIVKTNNHGTAVDYGVIGNISGDLSGKEISETNEGDLVLAGTLINTINSNSNTYIARIQQDLFSIVWETILSDDESNCNDMIITNDEVVLLSTLNWGSEGHTSIVLNRVDLDGDQAEKIALGYGTAHLKAMSFNTTTDGGLIIVGSNRIAEDEVMSLIKVNTNCRLY